VIPVGVMPCTLLSKSGVRVREFWGFWASKNVCCAKNAQVCKNCTADNCAKNEQFWPNLYASLRIQRTCTL